MRALVVKLTDDARQLVLELVAALDFAAGEFDIVTLVSASDIEEFRDILKNRILKIKGVKSTVSSVVLMAHKGPRFIEEAQKNRPQSRQ